MTETSDCRDASDTNPSCQHQWEMQRIVNDIIHLTCIKCGNETTATIKVGTTNG